MCWSEHSVDNRLLIKAMMMKSTLRTLGFLLLTPLLCHADDIGTARLPSEMSELIQEAKAARQKGDKQRESVAVSSFDEKWKAFLSANPNYWHKQELQDVAQFYFDAGRFTNCWNVVYRLAEGTGHPFPET